MKDEARLLAGRLGLQPAIVERWMAANRLSSIMDLRTRYPGQDHAECMRLACDEIWDFGMNGGRL